jgi:hypothetical protein
MYQYDRDVFMDMPLSQAWRQRQRCTCAAIVHVDVRMRQVNKVINMPVLKSRQSARVIVPFGFP